MEKIEIKLSNPDSFMLFEDKLAPGIKWGVGVLRFDEANQLPRGNANVRMADERQKPFKAMLGTIDEAPRLFHVRNRGITYICTDIELKRDKLVIHYNPKDYGVGDGGHTHESIAQTMEGLGDFRDRKAWVLPAVWVYFIASGDDKHVADTVQARNTSRQVQNYTMLEYTGEFEELKRALRSAGWKDTLEGLVAFRENDRKPWSVFEILQRLVCFDVEKWEGMQPIAAYKSKTKALEMYMDTETRERLQKLYPLVIDLITLPEYLESEFSRGIVPGRKLGNLKGVRKLERPNMRDGTTFETRHKFDNAAILPMAAAFRELLVERSGAYKWRLDPRQVFHHVAEKLYDHLAKCSHRVAKAGHLGSDVEYWSGCQNIIARYKDRALDK